MNNTLAGRVLLCDVAISIVDSNGGDPEGAFCVAARNAVDRAGEATGFLAYHPSDGDVYLDLQDRDSDHPSPNDDGDDVLIAVGIIVSALCEAGFPVLVVQIERCPECERLDVFAGAVDCPTCGGTRDVDNRAL